MRCWGLLFAAASLLYLVPGATAATPGWTSIDFAHAPKGPASAFASMVRTSNLNPAWPQIGLTARARRVAMVRWGSHRQPLLIAPTTGGGFCMSIGGAYGGAECRSNRPTRTSASLNVNVTGDAAGPIALVGYFFDSRGRRLEVAFRDGRTTQVPIVWVSTPINAGFFVVRLAQPDRRAGRRPVTVSLFDSRGRLLKKARVRA